MNQDELHSALGGSALAVKVKLGAKQDRVERVDQDGIVYVGLAVQDAHKANSDLCKLLGKTLGISQNQVEIVAGEGGTQKLVSLLGLSSAEVQTRMQDFVK